MAVVNGDVNVGVNVRGGQGDGARKVDETAASLDKLKGASDRTTTSVLTLKDKVGALKETAGPVNVVREGFENLRSNVGFVIASVTGLVGVVADVVGGIIELAQANDEAARATKRWGDTAEERALAVKSAWDALNTVKLTPHEEALRGINEQLKIAESTATALKDDYDELQPVLREMGSLRATQAALESAIARDNERQAAALKNIVERMREASVLAVPIISPFTGNADDLAVGTNFWGEGETPEMKAAREKRLRDALARARGGGSRPTPPASNREGLDALLGLDLSDDVLGDYLKSVRALEESSGGRTGEGGADGDLARGPSRMQALAGDIRDFTASLSESIPMMSEWSGALGQISQLWGDYAESGKGAARATILSVGAIAQAGAEQIKNERLRAGVLSVIHLGLGTALMFVAGAQQEAIGHLAGAAILGSVAIFGGGGGAGSSRGSSSSTRSLNRPLSERQTSGNTTVIINGTYIAGHTMQETAAELHALGRRGVGGGFVPAGG